MLQTGQNFITINPHSTHANFFGNRTKFKNPLKQTQVLSDALGIKKIHNPTYKLA